MVEHSKVIILFFQLSLVLTVEVYISVVMQKTRYLQDVKITEQEAFNGDNAWAAHADADGVLVISGNVEVNKSAGNNFDWATGSLQINKGNRLDIKQNDECME